MKKTSAAYLKNLVTGLDWPLLLFFIFLLNVKLPVKIAAVVLSIWLNRKSISRKKILASKISRFYLAILLLAGIQFIFDPWRHNVPGILSFATGILFWLLALGAWSQSMIYVEKTSPERMHRTITALFLLHNLIVLISFLVICIKSGSINPYTFQGMHQKYFISTGDYLTGIGFDTSVTTAIISAIGVLYFHYRANFSMALFSMICVLLAGSNLVSAILLLILIFIFLSKPGRVQKSMILIYLMFAIIFWARVSTQNKTYATELVQKIAEKMSKSVAAVSTLNPVAVTSTSMPAAPSAPAVALPVRDIDFVESPEIILRKEKLENFMVSRFSSQFRDSIASVYHDFQHAGKWIAWEELNAFYQKHPLKIFAGAGMGNFSSRLAFKTASLQIAGSYPVHYRYIHPWFSNNHLYLYLHYQTGKQETHSVANRPDSLYLQLFAEYGIAGTAAFLFLYAGGFLRRILNYTYGLPLCLLAAALFFMDYWFEQLSVMVLIEFLLLLDLKKND